ncbi:hypothetical protein [Polyangium jinanense]|uniref:Lipoprotein n=1 Tax=Polyangium jinanense TaxID=2829994 RepID=A0A9X4AXV7_9BACT|nr:hypothetical protein [Polyangium jinanense]MDC3961730.1 hypothetical protein [Polyangium jinanense]MDC3988236.1 hypothetical protein [Polyangium jinanense]
MKHCMAALGTLAMMSSGCEAIVLGPVEARHSETVVGPNPPDPHPNAIAMRVAELTLLPDTPHGVFEPQYQEIPDPDALVLFFSDSLQECSQPVIESGTPVPACIDPFWQLFLVIPPELNRPGVIDLQDRRIFSYLGVSLPSCGGATESYGHGFVGTLEIVESDATSVSVKLNTGTLPPPYPDVDGDYTATFCSTAPPPSPPSPALAVQGENLATPPGGASPDPDALYLFLGTEPGSCQDPWSPIDCTHTSRVMLRLPPSLQTPGIIDLTDPAIAASYWRGSAPGCNDATDTGPFAGGTIEILSIDAGEVLCKVYGSATPLDWGSFNADGLYAATLCP